MTKDYLKSLLKSHYKEKSEMPGLIVRGIRRPSYMIMYRMYKESNVPFTAWLNINEFLEEDEQTEAPPTEALESK